MSSPVNVHVQQDQQKAMAELNRICPSLFFQSLEKVKELKAKLEAHDSFQCKYFNVIVCKLIKQNHVNALTHFHTLGLLKLIPVSPHQLDDQVDAKIILLFSALLNPHQREWAFHLLDKKELQHAIKSDTALACELLRTRQWSSGGLCLALFFAMKENQLKICEEILKRMTPAEIPLNDFAYSLVENLDKMQEPGKFIDLLAEHFAPANSGVLNELFTDLMDELLQKRKFALVERALTHECYVLLQCKWHDVFSSEHDLLMLKICQRLDPTDNTCRRRFALIAMAHKKFGLARDILKTKAGFIDDFPRIAVDQKAIPVIEHILNAWGDIWLPLHLILKGLIRAFLDKDEAYLNFLLTKIEDKDQVRDRLHRAFHGSLTLKSFETSVLSTLGLSWADITH